MEKEVIRIEKGTIALESFLDGEYLPLYRISLIDGSESLTITESEILDLFKISQEDVQKIVYETNREAELSENKEELARRINDAVARLLFSQNVYDFITKGQKDSYEYNVEVLWSIMRNHKEVNTLVGDSQFLDLAKEYGCVMVDIGGKETYGEIEFFNYNNGVTMFISPRITVNGMTEISIKDLPCYEMLQKLYGGYIVTDV